MQVFLPKWIILGIILTFTEGLQETACTDLKAAEVSSEVKLTLPVIGGVLGFLQCSHTL